MIKVMFCFFALASITMYAQEPVQPAPVTMSDLAIEVSGVSREVVYTNKQAGILSTETNAEHRSPSQGWRIMSKEMLEDYSLTVDGRPLRKQDASRVLVYPHQLRRIYPNGLMETVTLLDSINAIVVELDSVRGREISVYPLFSDAHQETLFVTAFDRNILSIGHKDHIFRTAKEDYPQIVTVSWAGENLWSAGFYDTVSIGKNFSPANIKTVNPASRHVLVFAAGDSLLHALKVMRFVAKFYDSLLVMPKERMERLINTSSMKSGNKQLDKASDWARLSMDAMAMTENKKGIFEGLSLFENKKKGPGPIVLPGAIVATGNLTEAKEVLGAFRALQDTNAAGAGYGRIPVPAGISSTPNDPPDMTPWLTIVSGDYFRYSNDTAFIKMLYPTFKRGIEGKLKYHMDKGFLLTSGDHSVSAQLLWYQQLGAGIAFAKLSKDTASMERWRTIQQKLSRSLKK